jgi:hypothetical protein
LFLPEVVKGEEQSRESFVGSMHEIKQYTLSPALSY